MPLEDYKREWCVLAGFRRLVFTRGEGAGVIVIHEMPGITPEVVAFADRLVDQGFTVALPSLLGRPGAKATKPAFGRSALRLCVAREFVIFATGQTSPICGFLRALAQKLDRDTGRQGVGVVGMCFSGGFALAVATDPSIQAVVASQPSLPMPIGCRRRADAAVSSEDCNALRQRAQNGGVRLLGLRFTADRWSPPDRFASIRRLLGPAFDAIELDSTYGNDLQLDCRAHSVLTGELTHRYSGSPGCEQLEQVVATIVTLFQACLGPPSPANSS